MTFGAFERQRCLEIIYDEWREGSGIVKSKDVYQRLNAEGIYPPDGAMDSLLRSLEDRGLVNAAKMLGRDAISQHGNMWITRVADHTVEELWQFASILRDVAQGNTPIEDAQAEVQINLPDLAPLTRELGRTRNVQVRLAIIQWLLAIIGWVLVAQNVDISDVNLNIDTDVEVNIEHGNPTP